MSIFDRANVSDTGVFHYDRIRRPDVSLHCGDTGNVRPYTTDRSHEWALEIRLRQTFWANGAQRRDAEKIAMRALAASLYEDVLRHLPHLRLCISSGDYEGAMETIDLIEKATRP